MQRTDQLDRHLLLVAAVGAARAVDHAHPAGIQPPQQLVVADMAAGGRESRGSGRLQLVLEEAAEPGLDPQQALHAFAQRIGQRLFAQPGIAPFDRLVERGLEPAQHIGFGRCVHRHCLRMPRAPPADASQAEPLLDSGR